MYLLFALVIMLRSIMCVLEIGMQQITYISLTGANATARTRNMHKYVSL